MPGLPEGRSLPERADMVPPSGREQIMDAVLEAAREMLAEHSPSVLTVRQIAQRAGVPHSVVHRYFGTKDQLIRAVIVQNNMQELSYMPQLGTAESPSPDPLDSAFARTSLRMALDGIDPFALEDSHALQRALERVIERGPKLDAEAPVLDARTAVALAVATTMGWAAIGETALAALGVDAEGTVQAHADVNDVIASILGRIRPE